MLANMIGGNLGRLLGLLGWVIDSLDQPARFSFNTGHHIAVSVIDRFDGGWWGVWIDVRRYFLFAGLVVVFYAAFDIAQ